MPQWVARPSALSSSTTGVYFLSSTTPAYALFGAPFRECLMNHQFHHPARLAAWSLIICQLVCGAANAQRRGAALAPTKPDKGDTASAAETKDIGKDWVRMKYDSSNEPIAMQLLNSLNETSPPVTTIERIGLTVSGGLRC